MRVQGASLKYVGNPRTNDYRAAVVVSKKVHKSAVVRNRIRRRIYEQIRLQVSSSIGVDMAFMIYDDAFATMSPEGLAGSVTQLLQKAGVLRER